MMLRLVTTVIAAAALATPLTAQDTVLESSTNVSFPIQLQPVGGFGQQALVGTGARTRTILSVKVYALGVYIDAALARTAYADWTGKTEKDLEKDKAFHARVLQMDVPMTLRLVMTRDVDGEAMAEAFDGALAPRVQRAEAEMDMPGGAAALQTFRGFFSLEKVTKESELLFSCTPDGRLSTSIRGELQSAIESPALCWALFDVYLGEKPISGGAKKNIMHGFAGMLQSGQS